MPNSYFNVQRTAAIRTVTANAVVEYQERGPASADRERTVRDELAPSKPEVVYDPGAFAIAGKSRREFDAVSFMLALVHALAWSA